MIEFRETTEEDLSALRRIHREAFGESEGPVVADLVEALLIDATARPVLSLVAIRQNLAVGHVLFTKARVDRSDPSVSTRILAPLAVLPEAQFRGIGGRLVEAGLRRLREAGVDLVFVLGHPGYYPRFGFGPAGERGFDAPYPIPERNAPAWMVRELRVGAIGESGGRVQCCEAMDRPEYWRE